MQKLNELKAYGMPLPEDLVQFGRHLEAEFAADKEASESVTPAPDLPWVLARRATARNSVAVGPVESLL